MNVTKFILIWEEKHTRHGEKEAAVQPRLMGVMPDTRFNFILYFHGSKVKVNWQAERETVWWESGTVGFSSYHQPQCGHGQNTKVPSHLKTLLF